MAEATSLYHDESSDSREFECSHPTDISGNDTPREATKTRHFDEEDPGYDGQKDCISLDDDNFSEKPAREICNTDYPQDADDVGDNTDNDEDPDYKGNADRPHTECKILRSPSLASDITFVESPFHEENQQCTKQWSKKQKLLAVLGCLSSLVVCTIRLKIDTGSRTYLIHSIVVFFDMVLIHIFTSTLWLSITGEIVTVVSMLLYHYTKQKVWELLETTLLAMICSFHMISSRSEHWDREEELEGLIGLEIIANHHRINIKNVRRCVTIDLQDLDSNIVDGKLNAPKNAHFHSKQKTASEATSVDTVGMLTGKGKMKQQIFMKCSKHFFDHFLDGSAGVMYTSFLGLIIDEFLMWFVDDKKNG